MPCQFFGGILHFVQNDVKRSVIARHEVPRQSVGVMIGVYAANFTQGDRHACARDDRLFYSLYVNVK